MGFDIFSKVTHESNVGDTSFDKLFEINSDESTRNGKDGKDGKSITITSSSLDGSGNTVVTFSDGTNITINKGNNGTNGTNGNNGSNGTNGTNGTNGKSISIANSSINGSGNTVIVFTDGVNNWNVTVNKGDAGTNGSNGTNGTNGLDGTDGTDGTDISTLPYYNKENEIITPNPCESTKTYSLKYGCKSGSETFYWQED